MPYRDAKLTQLLWDGLRGSGRALMVACLAPLRQQAEESLNTLHFAGMALRVRGAPVVTMDPQASDWQARGAGSTSRAECPCAKAAGESALALPAAPYPTALPPNHSIPLPPSLQDAAVVELRSTVKALRADVRVLAGALQAVSQPGADVPSVLRGLPPTLLQDAIRAGAGGASAPAGLGRGAGSGEGGGGRRGQSSGRRSPLRSRASDSHTVSRRSLPASYGHCF